MGGNYPGKITKDYPKLGGLTQVELLTGLYKLVYDTRLGGATEAKTQDGDLYRFGEKSELHKIGVIRLKVNN